MRSVTAKAIAMLLLWGLAACSAPPAETTPVAVCPQPVALVGDDKSGAKSDGEDDEDVKDEGVTFYKDLYPILSSTKRGVVYKCVTCHPHYAKPEGMNNVKEVEAVIESMRKGRMPRTGDAVTPERIELFNLWRLQGFKPGRKGSGKPLPEVLDATAKTSTPGCPPQP